MKTPMQELIDRLNNVKPTEFCSIETIKGWAESLLEKEKALHIPDVSASFQDRQVFFDTVLSNTKPNENLVDAAKKYKSKHQREMKDKEDLNYWKANAEEDYLHTPISVLRYITELETAVENCSIPDVRLSLPTDEEIKQKAFDFSYVFRDDEDCKRSDAVETYCKEMGHWIKNKIQIVILTIK